eukprot:433416-Rhodomonas_salina.1
MAAGEVAEPTEKSAPSEASKDGGATTSPALLPLLKLRESLLEPLTDVTLSKKIEATQQLLRSSTEKIVS